MEHHPVFLQLFEAIQKTAAHPGETFTQSCAEKYDRVSALYRMFVLCPNTGPVSP